jgi:hypothetical protein
VKRFIGDLAAAWLTDRKTGMFIERRLRAGERLSADKHARILTYSQTTVKKKEVLYKHINSAVLQAAKEKIVFGGNCGMG